MNRLKFLCLLSIGCIGASICCLPQSDVFAKSKDVAKPSAEDLEHARDTVKILDEAYKRIIILVTDKYVKTEDDFAAGSAAVLLFKQMSEGGTHLVRLIDATGDPYEPANVAKDEFEKTGLKKLKNGAAEYERVVQKDGRNVLRVLTAVPVVHERCSMCHEHYNDVPEGTPIGAISYSIPIE